MEKILKKFFATDIKKKENILYQIEPRFHWMKSSWEKDDIAKLIYGYSGWICV